MKPVSLLALMAIICTVYSCSSAKGKKVVVMSSGKMQVDSKDYKTILFEPGTQHNDLELTLSSDDKIIIVKSNGSEKKYDIPDDALYLLNLKSDTMIGNLVNYGSSGVPASISGEQLEHIIDSTKQLLSGNNADDKKTFFLPPNTIKKISDNINAQLLSPYKGIPYKVDVDKNGNPPEMYKFFTNKQKRESLDELQERLKK